MKLEVPVTEETIALVHRALTLANASEHNSHGTLTVETLVGMLLEDVALVVRRPGSWEGNNMSHVLTSHGYEV